MTASNDTWRLAAVLAVALGACVEPSDASEGDGIESSAQELTLDGGPVIPLPTVDGGTVTAKPEVVFGDVIANNGFLFSVSASAVNYLFSDHWDTCPSGYVFLAHQFDSSGFWFCARQDLVNFTFNVGDVENDVGKFYRVSRTGVTALGGSNWDYCPPGAVFLNHRYNSNGFWVCYVP